MRSSGRPEGMPPSTDLGMAGAVRRRLALAEAVDEEPASAPESAEIIVGRGAGYLACCSGSIIVGGWFGELAGTCSASEYDVCGRWVVSGPAGLRNHDDNDLVQASYQSPKAESSDFEFRGWVF